MANYLVKEESLISIADAIREKTGETAELTFPEDFIVKINDLTNSSNEEVPSNGKDWIQSNISNITLTHVYNDNGIWVGCSPTGLYYSEDGKTWSQTNATTGTFYDVYGINGTWVASGSAGLYYSTDGMTWTLSNFIGDTISSPKIYYVDGTWFYSYFEMAEFYYSSDGISWETTGDVYPNYIYYNSNLNQWITWVDQGLAIRVYTSSNGFTWTKGSSGNYLWGLDNFCCANGLAVASFVSKDLYYSTDGINFIESNISNNIGINEIYYADGLWVAGSVDNGLYYSTDGMTWTQSAMNTGSFTSIYYENFMWVAGSTNGIYYSADGITWTQSTGITSSVEDVYCDGNTWVAATNSAGLYYSNSWTDSMKEVYDSISNGDEVSY